MRKSAHSRTAEITAAIRAGHYLYDDPLVFSDPYALALTSGFVANHIRKQVAAPLCYSQIVEQSASGARLDFVPRLSHGFGGRGVYKIRRWTVCCARGGL